MFMMKKGLMALRGCKSSLADRVWSSYRWEGEGGRFVVSDDALRSRVDTGEAAEGKG